MKSGWTIAGIIGIVVLVLLVCVGSAGMLMFNPFFGRGMLGRFGGYLPMIGFPMLRLAVPGIILLLLIVGVILFIAWVVQNERVAPMETRPTSMAPGETPLDVLKMRYAKGEITKEQFDAMKRDLGISASS